MIYGENRLDIAINKGLFLSSSPASIPDGYCGTFVNAAIDAKGSVVPRGNFKCVANFTTTGGIVTGGTNVIGGMPAKDNTDCIRAFSFDQGDELAALWVNWGNSTPTVQTRMISGTKTGVNLVKGEASTAAGGNFEEFKAMCQYRDRIYASNINGIYRVTAAGNFNGTTGTVTKSLLVASAGGLNPEKMVVFKDRVFAGWGSTVYYTEVATVGGYPENWNALNNKFEVGSDNGFAGIVNMFADSDKLYIFTTAGVYILYATGSPSSWTLQLANKNLKTPSTNSVCRVGSGFIVTDRSAIYAYGGGNTHSKIGDEIDWIFQYNGFEVFEFEQGFLLQVSATQGASVPLYYYYFDGSTWAEWTLPPTVYTANFGGISGTFVGKYTSGDRTQPRSYIMSRGGCWYYDANYFAGDEDAPGTPLPSNSALNVISKIYNFPFDILKRLKSGYIHCYLGSVFVGAASLTVGIFKDKRGARDVSLVRNDSNVIQSPGSYSDDAVMKLNTSGYYRQLGISLGATFSGVGSAVVPPLEIHGFSFLVEDEVRTLPEKANT